MAVGGDRQIVIHGHGSAAALFVDHDHIGLQLAPGAEHHHAGRDIGAAAITGVGHDFDSLRRKIRGSRRTSEKSRGSRHGREQFEGKPDLSKGSFYANPETDEPIQEAGFYYPNVWPGAALPELEPAFKDLGSLIIKTGQLLAKHIDQYVERVSPNYVPGTMQKMLTGYKSHIGRLLHYFPQQKVEHEWCGWHNDHGALTGLTCAVYIDERTGENVSNDEIQDDQSGLFVRSRTGETLKARLKSDLLLFQIGETAQVVSGGQLQATPHSVQVSDKLANISRNTLAVFMEPGPDFPMKCADEGSVFIEHEGVPPLRNRWKSGMNFGEFHHATLSYYN